MSDSTLTYGGVGNRIETDDFLLGGELVQTARGASLDLVISHVVVVEPELVRIVAGQTETIPFDAEGVSIQVVDGTQDRWIEVLGPDYDGGNPSGVLFADSPCVRRWEKISVDAVNNNTGLIDLTCGTPISGHANGFCPGGPPPGGVQESLYVMDLEVASGATLIAGDPDPSDGFDINIYYTGTLTNNGSIKSINGAPYAPIQLNPTLYGDFNGSGDGDEPDQPGSDTRRFNDAFCTCIGQPSYDIPVDWNCDGVIDDLDRDQYNANWSNPGAITTSPCTNPCSQVAPKRPGIITIHRIHTICRAAACRSPGLRPGGRRLPRRHT